jgi:hypothetical protein
MEIPCKAWVSHDADRSIAAQDESSLLESRAAIHNRSSTIWSFVAAGARVARQDLRDRSSNSARISASVEPTPWARLMKGSCSASFSEYRRTWPTVLRGSVRSPRR